MSAMGSGPLPEEVVRLADSGVAIWVATCDRALMPELARAIGVRFADDRRSSVVFVPDAPAGRTFENLRANGQITLAFGSPVDLRTAQVKGELIAMRPTREDERDLLVRFRDAFIETVSARGAPRDRIALLTLWPSTAVEVGVREVFTQTPGHGAGLPWR